jgi:hypothetical protein
MTIWDFRFWILDWRRSASAMARNPKSKIQNLKSLTLVLALLAAVLSGCAYVWGPGEGRKSGDSQTRTVHLETVENHLVPHRPGLEYELTDRLKEEIATDRRLVLSEGAAEVRLRVSLTRFSEPTQVEDLKTGDPAEIQLKATAVVEATGDHFIGGREQRTVTRTVSYAPGLGDSRREGLDRLWRDLAREIVDVAADEWANTP